MDCMVVQETQGNGGSSVPVSEPARSTLFLAVNTHYGEEQKDAACRRLCSRYGSGMHSLLCPKLHDKWRQGRKAA
jgi:hypothetical protein